MLVPATASIGTCSSSSARMTPMWAAPRAPPPLSTSPILGRPSAAAASAALVMAAGSTSKDSNASVLRAGQFRDRGGMGIRSAAECAGY
jgi:hypothetical protein